MTIHSFIEADQKWVGSEVTCSLLVRNAAGTFVDPAGVGASLYAPDNTVTAYVYGTDSELTKASTGRYALTVTPTMAGRWTVRFTTTTPDEASEQSFVVRASPERRSVYGSVGGQSANAVAASAAASASSAAASAATALAAVELLDLDIAGDSGTGTVDLDAAALNVVTTNDSLTTTASGNTLTISLSDVLEDLDTLGPPNNNNEFLVSTGAGVLNWERNATVRTSMGVYSTTEVDDAITAQATALASTSNGQGASLIGIEDSGELITATTVEGALAEIATTASVGTTWINTKVRGLDYTDSNTNAAANSALMATLISEGGALWFEEGDPWFSERISYVNKMMHLKGMGKGHTRLHFDDPASATATDNVGIYYVNTAASPYLGAEVQPVIDGLTIFAEYDSNAKDGTGIWLEQQKGSGAEDGPQLTNVHIRGITADPNQRCWNVGLRVLGFGVARFTSVSCSLKQNVSEACIVFDDSTAGSQASINPSLYKCSLYSAKYGVKFLGANEGGRLVGCNVQEVNWGVYKDHGASPNGSQPFLSLINTHINSYLGGVDIANGRYLIVDGCLWYAKVNADVPAALSPRSNYYFIRSIGPNDGGGTPASRLNFGHLITNSKFKANTVGTVSDPCNIYGVYAEYTERSIISNMTFESCTKPVYLGAGTRDWYVPDTNTAYPHPQDTVGSGASYSEPSDFATDLGVGNVINHKGFQRGAASLYDADGSHYVGIQAPSIVTTAHVLTMDGQNANRTVSFGGNLITAGDFATNGNVEITEYAASILDDATSLDVRRTISAARSAWIVEDSIAASGTASLVITNINQNYREMAIYFDKLSHDDAGSQHFRVEISYDNGGTYVATPVAITENVSAAAQVRGMVATISNYSVANTDKIVMAMGPSTQGTGDGILIDSTADGIDAIRITASAGNIDAGTLYVMVR